MEEPSQFGTFVILHWFHSVQLRSLNDMLFLSVLLLLPALVVTEYCYVQYCYNYDKTHIWCDQSEYLCTPGTWYSHYATCAYVGSDGAHYWDAAIWCHEDESCETNWVDGEPYCADWNQLVETGVR